ncbi:glycosyltransferase family 4 protein [Marinobacterium weihaiense]|uniref:Glycosyltransferase n=1 Tax=Marinobacterium weihaiense TaxID=2851016 RepID=A0ABS6M7P3_9GAMM|nr:glycosyltransferase [Marinobacterium weihaiense]MBV0932300.1 glycosyltransferase [Marinobacterium weihaiense]
MKIAIVAPSPVPFMIGGAEKLWWGILDYINHETPHDAELIKLPSPERSFPDLIASYRYFSELDLSHFDRVISTKYPAWMVAHHDHVCYLQHKLRGLYDTYHFCGHSTELPELPSAFAPLLQLLDSPPDRALLTALFNQTQKLLQEYPEHFDFPGPLTRAIIHQLDGIALQPGSIHLFGAISDNVRKRSDYFPEGCPVYVRHHPSDLEGIYTGEYRFIFTASRLDEPKRLDMLIRAFRNTDVDVSLLIAGTGPQEQALKSLADDDPRIRFIGYVNDSELVNYYANALFVPFIPYDEDYGLITIEAMQAGKAVLTTTDSGGVHEMVQHGVTGLSVAPEESALADAITTLVNDYENTLRMGQCAQQHIQHVSWEDTLTPILAPPARPMPGGRRLNLVVVSTFPAWPPTGGGQARLFSLYRQVARHHDVTLLCLGSEQGQRQLEPGLVEICVPYTAQQHRYSGRLHQIYNLDFTDILTADSNLLNTDFLNQLERLAHDADLMICSHPFLHSSIRAVWSGPMAYDAQDVELDVKAAICAGAPGTEHWLDKVRHIEQRCLQDSRWVVACSHHDILRLQALYTPIPAAHAVAPNGVDILGTSFHDCRQRSHHRAQLGLDPQQEVVLFMGSWHGPNIEAAHLLVELARQRPRLQFWLMGSLCSHPELQALPDNVKPLGLLPAAAKDTVMSAASIALNPMISGSGTNLKMLDYAAAGLDIITTPFGNRGLDFAQDTEVSIVDIEDFGAALDQLSQLSVEQRIARQQRARQRAAETFDWSVCARPLLELIEATA